MTGSAKLRRFRIARGHTNKTLAAALGVHPSMVVQLCAGTRSPSLSLACAIARLTDDWCEGPVLPFDWLTPAEDRAA